LLAALIANAALAVLSSLVHVRITVFVVSVAVLTLLFALLFKILPNAAIRWRDVWVGAAFTALLFVLGKFLFGVYLGRAGAVSAYGAASSLVIVLLWIYYSAQVLLFGAEFTQVYAHRSRDTQLEGTSHHPGPALTKGSACSSLGHF
jgi:membrane protein